MIYQEHIHKQKGVPNKFSLSVIVEVYSYIGFLQLGLLDMGNPGELVAFVEVVVSV